MGGQPPAVRRQDRRHLRDRPLLAARDRPPRCEIRAISVDPAFKGGDYLEEPVRGIETTSAVWLAWLYSQEWWRRELWKKSDPGSDGMTLPQYAEAQMKEFFAGADANNLILQMRTWQQHDVGTTPGFEGSTEKALHPSSVPVLYMPSETDLYFPLGDAGRRAGGSARWPSPPSRRSGATLPARARPRGPCLHRAEASRVPRRALRELHGPAASWRSASPRESTGGRPSTSWSASGFVSGRSLPPTIRPRP